MNCNILIFESRYFFKGTSCSFLQLLGEKNESRNTISHTFDTGFERRMMQPSKTRRLWLEDRSSWRFWDAGSCYLGIECFCVSQRKTTHDRWSNSWCLAGYYMRRKNWKLLSNQSSKGQSGNHL